MLGRSCRLLGSDVPLLEELPEVDVVFVATVAAVADTVTAFPSWLFRSAS